MYRLIVLFVGLIAAGPAWAVCPSTPADCPSGTANNWTVANALSVTGAASLLGGGTHAGTFTGGTFSGITLGGSITGTGATITGGTFSGITLSGTIAGTPTFSGALTLSSTLSVNVAGNAAIFGQSAGSGATARIQAAAGSTRQLQFNTGAGAAGTRWALGANATAESGTNAGSDFFLQAENDTGTAIANALVVTRSDLHAVWGGYAQANKGFFANMGTVTLPGSSTPIAAGVLGLYVAGTWTGTEFGTGPMAAAFVNMIDTADTSTSNAGGYALYAASSPAAGFKGNRSGILGSVSITAANGSASAAAKQYVGGQFGCSSSINDGGTGTANGQGAGSCFGANVFAELQSGATNWIGPVGQETDLSIDTGASAYSMIGHVVVLTTVNKGTLGAGDAGAYLISAQAGSTFGFRDAFAIGKVAGGSGVSMDPTAGNILEWVPAIYNSIGGPQFAPAVTLNGVNLGTADFTAAASSAFLSAGPYRVDGSGALYLGGGKVSYASAKLSIDAPGQCVTAAAVHAGRAGTTGNYVGDYLYDTTYHGQYKVATLGGVSPNTVATVTIQHPSCTTDVSPPTTLTMTGGSGNNTGGTQVQLDVTWTAATTLSLGSTSTDTLLIGGSVVQNATVGFAHPFGLVTTGAPSGTPTVTTVPPCVVNANAAPAVLDCYISGSWQHLTFTAGAG